jgi:hypothetical protein
MRAWLAILQERHPGVRWVAAEPNPRGAPMKTTLLIRVDMSDESDFDWLRNRCVPAVENAVEEAVDEQRLDGTAEVSWEQEEEEQ